MTFDDSSFFFLGASAVSGFFASACSLPFDYVKTQIQKMQPDAEGKYPYNGSLDCAMKTLKSGGPLKFYTGFPVYCVRIAPHVMVRMLYTRFQKLRFGIIPDDTKSGMFSIYADDLDFPQPDSENTEKYGVVDNSTMGGQCIK